MIKAKLDAPRLYSENGVDVVHHNVDQFIWMNGFYGSQFDGTEGEGYDKKPFLTAISFLLPSSNLIAPRPILNIYGDGRGWCDMFFNGSHCYEKILFSKGKPAQTEGESRDLAAFQKGVPVSDITPFLHEGGYPAYGIRRYDIDIGYSQQDFVRVQSTITENRELDRLDVFVNSMKGLDHRLEILRLDRNWSLKEVKQLNNEIEAEA